MMFCKACPKCNGDVYVYHDLYGAFLQCLQCGLLRDVAPGEMRNGSSTPGEVSELLADQLYYVKVQAVGFS